MGYLKFKVEALESFCLDAFVKFGFTDEESRIITDVLLLSDRPAKASLLPKQMR